MQKLNLTNLSNELLAVVNELKNGIGFNVDVNGTEVTVSKREKDGLTVKIADGKAVLCLTFQEMLL